MKNKKQIILVIIAVILILLSVITSAISAVRTKGVVYIINIVMQLIVLCYILIGYRKPHGNLLKYTFLLYALSLVVTNIFLQYPVFQSTLISLVILLTAFVGGRLGKIKKNIAPMVIVLILQLILFATGLTQFMLTSILYIFAALSSVIQWVVLCGAYIVRYRQHREAGLTDSPEMP